MVHQRRSCEAVILLNQLQSIIDAIAADALQLTEENHRLTTHAKVAAHDRAICAIGLPQTESDRDRASLTQSTESIEDIEHWMALSVEYWNS
jgi:hypothetical protein